MVRRGFSPFVSVFTRADTSTTTGVRFFALTGVRSTADIKSVRGLLDIRNTTGDTRFQFACSESDDPEAFPNTWTVIEPTKWMNNDGLDSNGGYITLNLTKTYVVFGVITRNESASPARIEHAWVSGRFDTRSC